MSARFAGQAVLITGAARGFGAAAAEAFMAEGAQVLLSDISPDVEAVAERLGGVASVGDVSAPDYHQTLVKTAKSEWGRLDIAVNNAGIAHAPAPLPAVDEATVQRVIEVDLLGVLWAHQAQIPLMAAQGGGVIVNVASVAGLTGAPGLGPYAAAKHGVVGLTRTAAAETARFGLRINAICPAFAKTVMVQDLLAEGGADAEKNLLRAIPMRRLAKQSEIVQAILWAAAPENSFMTGKPLLSTED